MTTRPKPIKQIGASILCFSRTPDCLLYFLLGKEAYSPGYRDSNKYSDFGGAVEPGETAEECASREFFEETNHVITPFIHETPSRPVVPVRDVKALTRGLLNHTYYARVDFLFPKRCRVCQYTTFLMEIPWIPNINSRLAHIRKTSPQPKQCLEKASLEYASPKMILQSYLPGSSFRYSTQFPKLIMRSFFQMRFRKIWETCFPKDRAFTVDVVDAVTIPTRLKTLEIRTSDSKKSAIDRNPVIGWERGKSIQSISPSCDLFRNFNTKRRNHVDVRQYQVRGEKRGTQRGRGPGILQNGVPIGSTHSVGQGVRDVE